VASAVVLDQSMVGAPTTIAWALQEKIVPPVPSALCTPLTTFPGTRCPRRASVALFLQTKQCYMCLCAVVLESTGCEFF